jgi:predicted MFS family arabinose efflux permease
MMMVQWTVTMARSIRPEMLARVSSYDALGSMMAMPLGALVAGPVASAIGVPHTEFAAAALIVVVSAACLLPRDIRATSGTPSPRAAVELAALCRTDPAVPAE